MRDACAAVVRQQVETFVAIGLGLAVSASVAGLRHWVVRGAPAAQQAEPPANPVVPTPSSAEVVEPAPPATPPAEPAAARESPPTKPTAPPSRTRSPERGSLTLNAIPWAKVTVDGKRLAKTTPIVGLKLPSGKHTVLLEGPKRRETLVVNIRPRRTVTKLVDLR